MEQYRTTDNEVAQLLREAQDRLDNRCMPMGGPQEIFGRKLVPIERDIVENLIFALNERW